MRARCTGPAIISLAVLIGTLAGCEGELNAPRFARRAERAYLEVHPGWTIVRRGEGQTHFARGDQQDTLRVDELYRSYVDSGRGASAFLEDWMDAQRALRQSRRRRLSDASSDVIPILKGGAWVRAQDLGAVGSARVRSMIRPWRSEIAQDVFVILGVPEARIGYRFASIDEVETSTQSAEQWLARAVRNLAASLGEQEGRAIYADDDEDQLFVVDLRGADGVSALILDAAFRRRMLTRFGLQELGAAVPVRNALYVFDPRDFVMLKPIRARAHELYDTENHPGFRGLLRMTADEVSVLEPSVTPTPGAKAQP